MIRINVKDLKPGMMLADDVGSLRSGALLVSKGTVLNKKFIKKIRNQGVKHIFIYDTNSDLEELVENNFVIRYEILSDKVEGVFKNICSVIVFDFSFFIFPNDL